MNTKSTQNWYETILDSQKKMAESMNEKAKQWGSSNEQVNKTLENSSDFFKKWLDFQMDFVKNTTQNDTLKGAEKAATESFNTWKNMYENLFKSQYDSINDAFKKNTEMFNFWNTQFTTSNPWAKVPGMDYFTGMNKNITEMYQTMMGQFNGNSNSKDVFEGMLNHTQSFMKFYELWSPIFKAVQNKTFTADMLGSLIQPDAYKGFMDSFFGFMPESVKTAYDEQVTKFTENMQSFSKQGMDAYKNFSSQWQQYIPQGNSFFTEALNNYNSIQNQMQSSMAPFAKLATPNAFSKSAEAVAEIIDMINRYQIANSQMQYLTYATGIKAMDKMGETIAEKLASGKTYESMQDLFKEWLNTSDTYFVELFESDEFSKIQAETSSLTLRIKAASDMQVEKMFSNVPLVPRSEMEEVYKTIYELKKRVRGLEKELENSKEVANNPEDVKATAAPKATAKKTTK